MKKEKYITELSNKNGYSYVVRIKFYDEEGQRKEHKKTFNQNKYGTKSFAKKAAMHYRDTTLADINRLQYEAKRATLEEVYEQKKQLFPLSKETTRKHDIYFRKYLNDYKDSFIFSITPKDITMSLNSMIDKSQDDINRVFSIWKGIYKCAIYTNIINSDPTLKVIVPKSEKITEVKNMDMDISLDEIIDKLRSYGKTEVSNYNGTIISYALLIMLYLGVRPNEAYALNVNDFDFEKKTVTINKSIGTTTTKDLAIKITKNKKSVRVLPLPDKLIPIIHELIDYSMYDDLLVKFDGGLISSRYYYPVISRALEGVDFTSYMLRHKFSSDLIESEVDLRTIQELMGHTNSATTLSYARSNMIQKRDAINKSGAKSGAKK